MKFFLVLSIFFYLPFYSTASKKIPAKIINLLQKNNLPEDAVLFIVDFRECNTCNGVFYNFIQGFYSMYKKSFFCLARSENEMENSIALFEQQNILISSENQIVDEVLYDFFYKEKQYLVGLNSDKFNFIDCNNHFSSELSFLNDNLTINFKQIDSTVVNVDFLKSTSLRSEVVGKDLYILQTDLNEFYILKNFESPIRFNFDSLVDKNKLLQMMQIDSIDFIFTKDKINSKTFGDRFLDVMNFSIGDSNEIYFTLSCNYTHKLSELEIKNAIKGSKHKNIKDIENVTALTTRHALFILKTTSDFNNIKTFKVASILNTDYSVDFYSSAVFKDSLFYLNSIYYKEIDGPEYGDSNFILARFKCNQDELVQKDWLNIKRPRWYNRKSVKNNFTNSNFTRLSDKIYYHILSYPFFVSITESIKYEVPEKALSEITKFEKVNFLKNDNPTFRSDCVIKIDDDLIGLVFSGIKSKNLYVAVFHREGYFIKIVLVEKREKFNGRYYCYNNNLYRSLILKKSVKELRFVKYMVSTKI
jgi:hypothetical protein